MKRCPKCGFKNNDEQKWCAKCLKVLPVVRDDIPAVIDNDASTAGGSHLSGSMGNKTYRKPEENAETGGKGDPLVSGFAPSGRMPDDGNSFKANMFSPFGYCEYCGEPLQKDVQFCTSCGKPHTETTKSVLQIKRHIPKAPLLFASCLLIGIFICLLGLFLFKQQEENSLQEQPFEAYYKPLSASDIAVEDNMYYVASRLYLVAAENVGYAQIQELSGELGGEIVGYISDTNDYEILFSETKTYQQLDAIRQELTENKLIDTAYISYASELSLSEIDYENDPWIDTDSNENPDNVTWDADNPSGSNWWAEATKVVNVWDRNLTFSKVKIGIIDSMFDTTHQDLDNGVFAKVWNNSTDSNGNCNVSTLYEMALTEQEDVKWSLDKKEKEDAANKVGNTSHGSHVAGIIAAQAGNSAGITGICQNAELYGYALLTEESKASDDERWGSVFLYKCAIARLLHEDVKVINISMGYNEILTGTQNGDWNSRQFTEQNSELLDAFLVKYIAKGKEFLIVKSAGNDSSSKIKYDAKYDVFGAMTSCKDRILIVGASDQDNKPAAFSNIGSRINVWAPGVKVLSTIPGNGAAYKAGTSMATPIVSGAAGLIWGINPSLSAKQVKNIIEASAEETSVINIETCILLAQTTFGNATDDSQTASVLGGIYCKDEHGNHVDGFTVESVKVYDSNGKIASVPLLETLTDIKNDNTLYEYTTYSLVLSPGTYTVVVKSEEYGSLTEVITVASNETKNLDFVFTKNDQSPLVVPITDDFKSTLMSNYWSDWNAQWNYVIRFHESGTYTQYPVDLETNTIDATPISTGIYSVTNNVLTLDGYTHLEYAHTSESHPDWPGWAEDTSAMDYSGYLLFQLPNEYMQQADVSLSEHMCLIPYTPKETIISSELCGQWNLYKGGTQDSAGNWNQVGFSSITLQEDGTVMIDSGIVKSDVLTRYHGTWSTSGKNAQGNYSVKLSLTDRDIEFAQDYWIVPTAKLSGDQLSFTITEDPYGILCYGEVYERNLPFDEWVDRKTSSGNDDWRNAYRNWIIQQGKSDTGRYGLFYMNDDEIPELYADTGGSEAKICTYSNGSVTWAGVDSTDILLSYENGCLKSYSEKKGVCIERFYEIQNGSFVELGYGMISGENYSIGVSASDLSSSLFNMMPSDYIFTNGAGAWATELTLSPDGSFVGKYHDSEYGIQGEGYSNGTVYLCNFSGKFSSPVKVNDYTYSMTLEWLTTEEEEGSVYFENNIRYIISNPYGMEDAEKFFIYLPGAAISALPEDFLSWAHLDSNHKYFLPNGFFGIYNENSKAGFIHSVNSQTYQWNGQEVNETVYYTNINNLCGTYNAKSVPAATFSYDQILNNLLPGSISEVQSYTQFLKNQGYDQLEIEHTLSTDITGWESIEVTSCLIDIDGDFIQEGLIRISNPAAAFVRGYPTKTALLDMDNGEVQIKLSATYGGGSIGGDYLELKYDQINNEYVIALDTECRLHFFEGVFGLHIYSNTINSIEKKIERCTYSNGDGCEFCTEGLEKLKQETNLYNKNEYYTAYYLIDGCYVSTSEYEAAIAQFIDPDASMEYHMRKTSLENPF